MRNYDFNELLSDKEFQTFAAEVIEVRENIKIYVNPMGPDKGIDFYDANHKIMGQVKLRRTFSSLKSSLKEEFIKVKKENPERYILVTSLSLNKNQKQIILNMFENYLKEEDILDRIELNRLLDNKKYNDVETKYLNLLAPNTFVLETVLDKIVHKKIINQSENALARMQENKKFFITPDFFSSMLNRLFYDRVLIISGEPGIGKTINGLMLCDSLIKYAKEKAEFISVKSIDDLYEIYKEDKMQIFFFDDFWGDTKKDLTITSKENERLNEMLTRIHKSSNKWLVMTTREYVFNDVVNVNYNNKNHYKSYKYIIELKELNKLEKLNILLKLIARFNLPRNYAKILLDNYKKIVDHINFNPRLIENYFENTSIIELNEIDFIYNLLDYLKHPYDYFTNIFESQSDEIKYMLLFIGLSEKDIPLKYIEKILNKYLIKNPNISSYYSLNEYLSQMENTFVITNTNENNEIILNLKNPSYKDFIENYIKEKSTIYEEDLINNIDNPAGLLVLLESLNRHYDDSDSNLLTILSKKIIDVFKHNTEISQIEYLLELIDVMDFKTNIDLKNFIMNYYEHLVTNFEEEIVFKSYENYYKFPELLLKIKPYIDLHYIADDLISNMLLDYIFYVNEYFYSNDLIYSWLSFKEIFPKEFNNLLKERRKTIKEVLYSAFLDDVTNCLDEGYIDDAEELYYEKIDEIYSKCGYKCPKSLKDYLEEVIENYYANLKKIDITPEENAKKDTEEDYQEEIAQNIEEYLGEDDKIYSNTILKYLESTKSSKEIRDKIYNLYQNKSLSSILVSTKSSIDLMIEYFNDGNKLSNNDYENLNNIINYIKEKDNIDDSYIAMIKLVGQRLFFKGEITIKKEEFPYMVSSNEYVFNQIVNNRFFVKQGEFYKFRNILLAIYLSVDYVAENENYHNLLININYILENIGYYPDRIVSIFELYKNYDKFLWENIIVKPLFNEILETIDPTDDETIALSFLKYFNFDISYNFGMSTIHYNNCPLINLIFMYYETYLPPFFDFSFEDREEPKELIEINDYLNDERFIKYLYDNNIIKELNSIYNSMQKFVNKEKITA